MEINDVKAPEVRRGISSLKTLNILNFFLEILSQLTNPDKLFHKCLIRLILLYSYLNIF